MSNENENKETRIGLWLAGGAAALATATVLLFAIWNPDMPVDGQAKATQEAASDVMASEAAVSEETAIDDAVMNAQAANNEGAAPADAAPVEENAVTDADEASVVVENGVVKFYFASGKADLAVGTEDALKDVLAGVKEGKKAIISGYHDTTGNQAKNEELSKQRALSVKNALLGLGVSEEQIELRKPADSEGSGNNAEARRVEVVLE